MWDDGCLGSNPGPASNKGYGWRTVVHSCWSETPQVRYPYHDLLLAVAHRDPQCELHRGISSKPLNCVWKMVVGFFLEWMPAFRLQTRKSFGEVACCILKTSKICVKKEQKSHPNLLAARCQWYLTGTTRQSATAPCCLLRLGYAWSRGERYNYWPMISSMDNQAKWLTIKQETGAAGICEFAARRRPSSMLNNHEILINQHPL